MATADTVTRRRDVAEATDVNLNGTRIGLVLGSGLELGLGLGTVGLCTVLYACVKGVRVSAHVYSNAKNALK